MLVRLPLLGSLRHWEQDSHPSPASYIGSLYSILELLTHIFSKSSLTCHLVPTHRRNGGGSSSTSPASNGGMQSPLYKKAFSAQLPETSPGRPFATCESMITKGGDKYQVHVEVGRNAKGKRLQVFKTCGTTREDLMLLSPAPLDGRCGGG